MRAAPGVSTGQPLHQQPGCLPTLDGVRSSSHRQTALLSAILVNRLKGTVSRGMARVLVPW